MTDQVVETQNTETPPEVVEQTLDDLYKESGLDVAPPQIQAASAPQPQYTPPVQPTVPEVNVPDPYDVENHKAFLANLARNQTALHESLQSAQKIIAEKERETLMAKLEEEINQASDFVAKESGIDNPKLATFELSERARTDPKFKAIWEGRNSSPQAKSAYTKALGVISREIGKKYEVRSDPQLVAQKKALAASRQSSSTTTQEEKEDKWDGMSPIQFNTEWERMVRNNN